MKDLIQIINSLSWNIIAQVSEKIHRAERPPVCSQAYESSRAEKALARIEDSASEKSARQLRTQENRMKDCPTETY